MSEPALYELVRERAQTPDQPVGVVGHVVAWPDGSCILKWSTEPGSEERYPSMVALRSVRLASGRCTLRRHLTRGN